MAPTNLAIDYWPHPITSQSRGMIYALEGQTLEEAMRGLLPPRENAVATVNGNLFARTAWDRVYLKRGDVVQVRMTVRSGGGSNPIAMILSLAILFAAPYAAGFILPGIAAGVAAGTASVAAAALLSGVTALIGIGGLLIVNAIFPPRLPDTGGAGGQADRIYTLAGGANRARPHEPLQLLLGSHRMFPDLVAREYSEFDKEGEQYLNQVFDFGIGNLGVSSRRMGETSLADFVDIQEQIGVRRITLVSGNVDTITGGEMEHNTAILRTTAVKTTKIAFDVAVQHFAVERNGKLKGREVLLEFEWKLVSSSSWVGWRVTIDTPDGPEARNATRRSYEYTVSEGQYDLRATLITGYDADADLSKINISAQLAAFRAYQDSEADFIGRHPLAIRAKASGQLFGRMETINADVDQLVDAWNGSAWVADQVSGNCGDVLLKYYRGWRTSAGVLQAGWGLADSEIDFPAIQGFREHCKLHSLECNVIIQDRRDHADIIKLITQCGWGSYDISSGKKGVIWEDANRPITAIVSPANIVADSISVLYDNEGLADEVVGTFRDKDSDYQENTIRRTVPTVSNPERPVTVNLEGITNGTQAAKELNRTAAAQFYHQRVVTWEMTEEGFLGILRGSVVGFSHDLIGGSKGGYLTSINARRTTVDLLQEVTGAGSIWIWDLNGQVISTTYSATSYPTKEVTLADALPTVPGGITDDPVSYRYMTFADAADVVKVRITGVEHVGGTIYRFSARDEVPEYYAARVADLTYKLLPRGEGDGLLIPVGAFRVNLTDIGIRRFDWAPHPLATVIGYQIRYGSVGQAWADMKSLHDGLLTSAPWEVTDRPEEGTYRFAIVAVTSKGRRTEPTYANAVIGPIVLGIDGEDGNGVEYVFARTLDANIPANQRPSNDWGYDQPGTVGTLRWHDGGVALAEDYPYLWRAERRVPGSPDVGTAVEGVFSSPVIVGRYGGDGPRGLQGLKGVAGADGDDGMGVEYLFARTSTVTRPSNPSNSWGFDSPSSPWTDAAPSLSSSFPYLWRAERRVDGQPSQGTAVAARWTSQVIVGRYGTDGSDGQRGLRGVAGAAGDDGEGIEWIFARTSTATRPSSPSNTWGFDSPSSPWTDAAPSLSATSPYLWRSQRKIIGQPANGSSVTARWTSQVIVGRFGVDGSRGLQGLKGVKGVNGDDGEGIEWIFARTSTATRPISPSNTWGFDSPSSPWTDAAPSLSATSPYLWRSQRKIVGQPADGSAVAARWSSQVIVGRYGTDGSDGERGLAGIPGVDGDDGAGIEYIFARTSTISRPTNPSNSWGFDAPRSPWSDAAPGISATYPYLWTAQRKVEGVPSRSASVSDSWTSPKVVARYGTDGSDGQRGLRGVAGSGGQDGDDGDPGRPGYGYEFIFIRNSGSRPTSPSNSWGYDSPRSGWSDAASGLTATFDTLWSSHRKVVGSKTFNQSVSDSWSTPAVVGRYATDGTDGTDGRGISGVWLDRIQINNRGGLDNYAVDVTVEGTPRSEYGAISFWYNVVPSLGSGANGVDGILTYSQGRITVADPSECFPSGTSILMATGEWRAIERLRIGDVLTSPLGPRGIIAFEFAPKRHLIDNSTLLVEMWVRVHGELRKISCTWNHNFLTPHGDFGAILPKPGRGDRTFRALVDSLGTRERWKRGGRKGKVRKLKRGDAILWQDGSPAWIELIVGPELCDQTIPVMTPITGSNIIVAGGAVASGGYSEETAVMIESCEVRSFFAIEKGGETHAVGRY